MARKADGHSARLQHCRGHARRWRGLCWSSAAPARVQALSLYQQCLPLSFYQKCLPTMRICMRGHVENHQQSMLRAFEGQQQRLSVGQLILAPLTRGCNLPFRRPPLKSSKSARALLLLTRHLLLLARKRGFNSSVCPKLLTMPPLSPECVLVFDETRIPILNLTQQALGEILTLQFGVGGANDGRSDPSSGGSVP